MHSQNEPSFAVSKDVVRDNCFATRCPGGCREGFQQFSWRVNFGRIGGGAEHFAAIIAPCGGFVRMRVIANGAGADEGPPGDKAHSARKQHHHDILNMLRGSQTAIRFEASASAGFRLSNRLFQTRPRKPAETPCACTCSRKKFTLYNKNV